MKAYLLRDESTHDPFALIFPDGDLVRLDAEPKPGPYQLRSKRTIARREALRSRVQHKEE